MTGPKLPHIHINPESKWLKIINQVPQIRGLNKKTKPICLLPIGDTFHQQSVGTESERMGKKNSMLMVRKNKPGVGTPTSDDIDFDVKNMKRDEEDTT